MTIFEEKCHGIKYPKISTNVEKTPKTVRLALLASFMLLRCSMGNTGKKILIADSNEPFRKSLAAFIQGLGYEVIEAGSGPEALDKASSVHPHLIMLEVRLPGMNGDEVTAQLKRNSSTRNIPLILNTGWTTACNVEERINRALNAGADEILYKPLQFPMLRNVLRSYLFA